MKFERSKKQFGKLDVIVDKDDLCIDCLHNQTCALISAIQERVAFLDEDITNIETCIQYKERTIKRIK